MIDCAIISHELSRFDDCRQTEDGWRIATQCLYPSFERVYVFIVSHGDGFVVHDGSGAAISASFHGAPSRIFSRSAKTHADALGCEVINSQIRIKIPDRQWLWSAIASVANASAAAARAAIGKPKALREEDIIHRTKMILDNSSIKPKTQLNFTYPGKSGRSYDFDLSVTTEKSLVLVEAFTSHPNSVAAKYLAFSDTERRPGLHKIAVYDGPISPQDKVLMSSVADVIPFHAIEGNGAKALLAA